MVSTILKVLGEEITVGSGEATGDAPGSDFDGGTLIRVYNNTGNNVFVTVKNSDEEITGKFTLRTTETVFVRKMPAESIFASADILMVQVSF